MSESGAPGSPSREIIRTALLAGHGLESVEQRRDREEREGFEAARREIGHLVGIDNALGDFIFKRWLADGRTKGVVEYVDQAKRELGRA